METVKISGYVFSVDIEKTREYYRALSLCDCGYCRNFYAQIKGAFPKLGEFLYGFGVDISRPDEVYNVEIGDYIHCISADYTVCGSVKAMGHSEIAIADSLPLNIVITDGFASPNEQSGDYFTISVEGIDLPWALDEPLHEEKPSIKSFFQKLFRK